MESFPPDEIMCDPLLDGSAKTSVICEARRVLRAILSEGGGTVRGKEIQDRPHDAEVELHMSNWTPHVGFVRKFTVEPSLRRQRRGGEWVRSVGR